ncbi:hypothetical protein ACLOJK_030184 [Asimina triloba]
MDEISDGPVHAIKRMVHSVEGLVYDESGHEPELGEEQEGDEKEYDHDEGSPHHAHVAVVNYISR